MKKSVCLLLVAGALLGGLSFIACGDDDDSETAGDGTTAATSSPDRGDETPAATSPGSAGNDKTPPASGGSTSVDVTAEDFTFNPSEITVPAGEPITFNFTNLDSVTHTFTLYVDEGFTQAIDGGSATTETPEITVVFVDPAKYYFRCEIHPSQMQGELTAQ